MKILPPFKISAEIIDIIFESKEYLVIVSPYVNFNNWEAIIVELKNALKRGVRIDFFVRNEPENSKSWEQLAELGINARLVSNLHAKFYFNEKNGLISSMNLLSSSNSNSIEIGCKLDKTEEIEDLKRFVKDFICVNESAGIPSDDDLYLSKEKFAVVLQNFISYNLQSKTSIFYKNGEFKINTFANQFFLGINKVNNKVNIAGIISQDEGNLYRILNSKYFNSKYFDYQFHKSTGNSYNMISAETKVRLSNSFLDNLRTNEKKELISEIIGFLYDFNEFKNACYQNVKKS